jgi:rod shape-determining protein MreD
MARRRGPGWVTIAGLLLAALAALIIPLPRVLAPLRPDFVALVVLWLCLLSPRPTGLVVAFVAGLAVDAVKGLVLGQHALVFIVMAYIALKLRLQIRAFPLLQQSAVVFALLALGEFLVFWIDGVTGHAVTEWTRWLGVLVGAACWPLLAGLLDRYLPRA